MPGASARMAETAKIFLCNAGAIQTPGQQTPANEPATPVGGWLRTAPARAGSLSNGGVESVCDHGIVNADQRRQAIKRMLAEDGSLTQQQLAAQLSVTQNTISKDLRALEEREGLNLRSVSGRGRPRLRVVDAVTAGDVANGVSSGDQLIAKLRAELDAKGLEPDQREEGLLKEIRDTADDIAELRARIDAEGSTFAPSTKGGPPRLHPAIAEVRQLRSLLSRLLSQIQLEESTKSAIKQKAANTRWRPHRMALAARHNTEGDQRGEPQGPR